MISGRRKSRSAVVEFQVLRQETPLLASTSDGSSWISRTSCLFAVAVWRSARSPLSGFLTVAQNLNWLGDIVCWWCSARLWSSRLQSHCPALLGDLWAYLRPRSQLVRELCLIGRFWQDTLRLSPWLQYAGILSGKVAHRADFSFRLAFAVREGCQV